MSLNGILLFSLRAAGFALAVCALWAGICRLRGRPMGRRRMLGLFYIAALVQITVLRGGVDWLAVFSGQRQAPQLIPLKTILGLIEAGDIWNLVYNVAGNLIWFVPLGMLLKHKGRRWPLGLGAAVSAGIEICQYLLITGTTDVDDIILNALGAFLGWSLMQIKIKRQS